MQQVFKALIEAWGLIRAIAPFLPVRPGIYRRFFEGAPYGCVVAEKTGHFIVVNEQFASMLGYTKKELTDVPFMRFVHPSDIAATRTAMENLDMGASVIDFRNRYRRRDGRYVWIRWQARQNGLIYAVGEVVEGK